MNGWDHPHNTSLEGRDVSESSARSEGISRTRKRAFNVTLRNTKNRVWYYYSLAAASDDCGLRLVSRLVAISNALFLSLVACIYTRYDRYVYSSFQSISFYSYSCLWFLTLLLVALSFCLCSTFLTMQDFFSLVGTVFMCLCTLSLKFGSSTVS